MTYREFIRDYSVDDLCKYCKLYDECNGDVKSDGNGEPVYPPCADLANDDELEFIDVDLARNN
jgi:hypothetical protein